MRNRSHLPELGRRRGGTILRRAWSVSDWRAAATSALGLIAMFYYNRGVDAVYHSRYAESVAANRKALLLDPNNATARGNLLAAVNNWALALADTGRFEEAELLLADGRRYAPDHLPFVYNAAHVQRLRTIRLRCRRRQFWFPRRRISKSARFELLGAEKAHGLQPVGLCVPFTPNADLAYKLPSSSVLYFCQLWGSASCGRLTRYSEVRKVRLIARICSVGSHEQTIYRIIDVVPQKPRIAPDKSHDHTHRDDCSTAVPPNC